jgi:dihydroneopterin aldolase
MGSPHEKAARLAACAARLMDFITIHDLRVETQIGFHDWERRLPQTIQLDLELAIPDTQAAARSDRLADTIDYGAVVRRVRESLATQRFVLLEALSEHVAGLLRTEFGSPWVRVSVSKLGVIKGVRRVGVTIERGSKT